ncbi:hypothetical protein Dimus_019994 [Dionaea muscipula]
MGKHGQSKKQRHQHQQARFSRHNTSCPGDDDEERGASEHYPCTPPPSSVPDDGDDEEVDGEEPNHDHEGDDNRGKYHDPSTDNIIPSKFVLYQQSVQSPKGDISYLQKFFLMYVGGRMPLHLQEDFCGTAFLSMEWLRTDARRTAVGLDLDKEALLWCTENNINNVGADSYSRIFLFHGNVLHPHKATIVKLNHEDPVQTVALGDRVDNMQDAMMGLSLKPAASSQNRTMTDLSLPGRDIVCAFNYSCCCLHERKQLVLYFKNAHDVLSRKGGIFVMDLYGGTSSEQELRLQRRFPNFTYIWEQEEFDIIQRKTRISLHFHLHKPRRKIRHAFSYSWRLWSLPEVRDCLEEAGFRSVHFWIREMPNTEEHKSTQGFGAAHDLKYEELTRFQQLEAWNAYVVAVA